MKQFLLGLITALALCAPAVAEASQTVLAGNAATISQLTPEQARAFYLGERTFIDKVRVTPIIYQRSSPVQRQFFDQVLHMPETRYRSLWIRKVFRGDGSPPLEVTSARDVTQMIATIPGAIGFVPEEALAGQDGLVPLFTVDGIAH